MKITLMTTLILGAVPVYAGAAKAAEATDPPQTAVVLSDLDLGRTAGAAVALSRIQYAARTVCGPVALPVELAKAQRRRACIAQATENAVRDLDAPLVTARYYHTEPTRIFAAK